MPPTTAETAAHSTLRRTLSVSFILMALFQATLLARQGQPAPLGAALGTGLLLGLMLAAGLARRLRRSGEPATPVIPCVWGMALLAGGAGMPSLHLSALSLALEVATALALLALPLFFRRPSPVAA